MTLITRAYNTIAVNGDGTITKTSTNPKLMDEIRYYRLIQAGMFSPSIPMLFPRLIDSFINDSGGPSHLCLEFYDYPTLGNIRTVEQNSPLIFDWLDKVLLLFANETFDSVKQKQFHDDQIEMYQNKPMSYFNEFKHQLGDMALLIDPTIMINGKVYENFPQIHKTINRYISVTDTSCLIHGDMCFSNMLWSSRAGLRFIDMRGRFGLTTGIVGDQRYDVAKLYHSTHGMYDALIRGEFTLNKNATRNEWDLKIHYEGAYQCVQRAFENSNIFKRFSEKEIKLIAGTIFIGMCSRHYESLNRQIAMYLIGVRMLNEALAI